MSLGLSTVTFTSVHVALSLIGIVSGVIVLYGMVRATRFDAWTALFLATTVLTSVTAFFLPSTSFGPAHVVGVLSLVVLAAVIVALYFFRLAGPWRWIYIVGAVVALYLNVFVAVVQAFQKLKTFRGNSAFYSWLFRIALNAAATQRRRTRGSGLHFSPPPGHHFQSPKRGHFNRGKTGDILKEL